MKRRVIFISSILLFGALAWWLDRPRGNPGKEPPALPEIPAAPVQRMPVAPAAEPIVSNPPAAEPQVPVPTPPRTEESRASSRRDLANPLVPASFEEPRRSPTAGPDSTIAADLDKVSLMLRDYRTLTGGNPEGTNAEIMKAIMGGNPKGAMLGPPDGQSVNGNGELIDHWGTPYFFHQLSKDLMEIRSAGPDGRLWNEDDIIEQ